MGISYSTLYFLGQEIKKKRKTNTLLELWKIAQQAYEITIWLFLGCFFFLCELSEANYSQHLLKDYS